MLELIVVLTVLGIVLALVIPRFRAARDARSVHGATDALAAAFGLARQSALARRSAVAVVFDTVSGVVAVRAGRVSVQRSDLGAIFGVALAANRDSAVYDARGFGYGVSNLTVIVRRGNFVDTLTMSRLGRVRW